MSILDADKEALAALKKSLNVIGQLCDIIEDTDGEVLSGFHRKLAGAQRKTVYDTKALAEKLKVRRATAKLLVKQHANTQRQVSKREAEELVETLARDLAVTDGVQKSEIARKIVELTSFSPSYVYELLPKKYKDQYLTRIKQNSASGITENVDICKPPPYPERVKQTRVTGSTTQEKVFGWLGRRPWVNHNIQYEAPMLVEGLSSKHPETPCRLDTYLFDWNTDVECDGPSHQANQRYDDDRDRALKEQHKINVIRFPEPLLKFAATTHPEFYDIVERQIQLAIFYETALRRDQRLIELAVKLGLMKKRTDEADAVLGRRIASDNDRARGKPWPRVET